MTSRHRVKENITNDTVNLGRSPYPLAILAHEISSDGGRIDRALGVLAAVLLVVPLAQLVAVLPAGCECAHCGTVHEASDVVDVCLARGGVGDVLELLARVDFDLHEASPTFRIGDDATAVGVDVDIDSLLPRFFVA